MTNPSRGKPLHGFGSHVSSSYKIKWLPLEAQLQCPFHKAFSKTRDGGKFQFLSNTLVSSTGMSFGLDGAILRQEGPKVTCNKCPE